MKNSFKELPILLVFLIASGFSPRPSDGIQKDKERIEVSFNSKMEFNDLVKIKLDLAEFGISIDYRLLEFDKQGGLRSLDFHVDCNDGFSGGDKNTNITNQSRWGFFRDYNKGAEAAFGTGGLQ